MSYRHRSLSLPLPPPRPAPFICRMECSACIWLTGVHTKLMGLFSFSSQPQKYSINVFKMKNFAALTKGDSVEFSHRIPFTIECETICLA